MMTEIHFDQSVDKITVVPGNHYRDADFMFGEYSVNLDLQYACCEKYDIYINGNEFTFDKKYKKNTINIKPSTSAVFSFGEKTYHHRKDCCYQKNFMTINFDGGDRIRVNRHAQYLGKNPHPNIYTRCVYLDHGEEFKMIGMV